MAIFFSFLLNRMKFSMFFNLVFEEFAKNILLYFNFIKIFKGVASTNFNYQLFGTRLIIN